MSGPVKSDSVKDESGSREQENEVTTTREEDVLWEGIFLHQKKLVRCSYHSNAIDLSNLYIISTMLIAGT